MAIILRDHSRPVGQMPEQPSPVKPKSKFKVIPSNASSADVQKTIRAVTNLPQDWLTSQDSQKGLNALIDEIAEPAIKAAGEKMDARSALRKIQKKIG